MGNVAGDLVIDGIAPDSSLLIAGPPMTGKYSLMLRVIAANADSTIVISTKNRAEQVRRDVRELMGDLPDDRIGVIDCVSHHESIGEVEETAATKYVNSPANLTGIGVRFTDIFGAFYDNPDAGHVGVGFHSVSQLLMHADMKQVYQFLQVLTGQIRSANWLGAVVVDTSTADDEELQMLQHHFDGLVETRETDDAGREYRVRGLTPTASEWEAF